MGIWIWEIRESDMGKGNRDNGYDMLQSRNAYRNSDKDK